MGWGVVLVAIGLTLAVIGFTGKQDNLIAAVRGGAYGKSNLS